MKGIDYGASTPVLRVENSCWSLQLFGRFKLVDPNGKECVLPTRKVEGLLAMLVLAPAEGFSRSFLQSSLWPEAALKDRAVSLRQALRSLKARLPAGGLEASRVHCSLSPELHINCDAVALKNFPQDVSPSRGPFMPSMTEPWFEQQRLGTRGNGWKVALRPALSCPEPSSSPIESFRQLLKWYSLEAPCRALNLLKENRDLANGLMPSEMKTLTAQIMSRLPDSHPMYGWGMFWQDYWSTTVDSTISIYKRLERARAFADCDGDTALQAESGIILGALAILLGRIDWAELESQRLQRLESTTRDRVIASRSQHLIATIALHKGDVSRALQVLQRSADNVCDMPFEHASLTSLAALYSAIDGRTKEAERLLRVPDRLGISCGHFRLISLCDLTRVFMALREGQYEQSNAMANRLLKNVAGRDNGHFEIYAREACAVSAWKLNERREASEQFGVSQSLRSQIGLVYSEWDSSRLVGLPAMVPA